MEMEVAELDEVLKVVNSCLSRIKWRLKSAARRRLEIGTLSFISVVDLLGPPSVPIKYAIPKYNLVMIPLADILALCTGLRPVVMVDYGGKLPELQERLCTVLQLSQKESSVLKSLRVMVIEDMIYLLNVGELVEHVTSSLKSEAELQFVDLEQDPPKMISCAQQNPIAMQFESLQRIFSAAFPADGTTKDFSPCPVEKHVSTGEQISSQSSTFIDLGSCLQESSLTIPTLNGWLLGYPVVYLFGKDHIADAIYNLSTKDLHLYKILICRKGISGKGTQQEELMSFSVPYCLSMGGKNEPWAEAFLARILTKLERCKRVWRDLHMEATECNPQAIAL